MAITLYLSPNIALLSIGQLDAKIFDCGTRITILCYLSGSSAKFILNIHLATSMPAALRPIHRFFRWPEVWPANRSLSPSAPQPLALRGELAVPHRWGRHRRCQTLTAPFGCRTTPWSLAPLVPSRDRSAENPRLPSPCRASRPNEPTVQREHQA